MTDSSADVWCKTCVDLGSRRTIKKRSAHFGIHTVLGYFLNFNTCTVHLFIIFIITNKCKSISQIYIYITTVPIYIIMLNFVKGHFIYIYTVVILIVHLLVIRKINHTFVSFKRQTHLQHSHSRHVRVTACELLEINVAGTAAAGGAGAYTWCPE
jgi:hypothetical protein